MSYKCAVCGRNDVDHPGDVCELCAIGQDPYAPGAGGNAGFPGHGQSFPGSGSTSRNAAGQGSYTPKQTSSRKVIMTGGQQPQDSASGAGNPRKIPGVQTVQPGQMPVAQHQPAQPAPVKNSSVQVYSPGQAPSVKNPASANNPSAKPAAGKKSRTPVTSGITKNITLDTEKKSKIVKWCKSLFNGVPYTPDDDLTMFQVFPDFSGSALNAAGNACDQVIVYGKLHNGTVSENNDVEVFGKRDSKNNIVASMIRNKASGTVVTPLHQLPAAAVWAITLGVLAVLAYLIYRMGAVGIVWTAAVLVCVSDAPTGMKVFTVILAVVISWIMHMFLLF